MLYIAGTSLCGVKAKGIVRASCIVIAVSACWLINRALARTPPGMRAGGMITTSDLVPCFLSSVASLWWCGLDLSVSTPIELA